MDESDVLCIASCGKAKIWKKNPHAGPTKASDAYVGPYSKRCIEYARKFYPSSWCILSGKHGFLLPDDIVPGDYNATFSDKRTNPISIDKLVVQVEIKKLRRFKKIVVMAGANYAKIAAMVFPNALIITPLSGCGGNISQANILAKAIESGTPLENLQPISQEDKNDELPLPKRQVTTRSLDVYLNDETKSTSCQWLHEQLDESPIIRYPFDIDELPDNGIYFFYEDGEIWGHGRAKPRIVRIGTHKDGNFKSRISEHFLLNESKMNSSANTTAPHERSIFRKNLGRALLEGDDYLKVWEIDFTTTANKRKYAYLRNVEKEKKVESQITKLLRERFWFRFILLEGQAGRMGSSGLESRLIATVANCQVCKPSEQ